MRLQEHVHEAALSHFKEEDEIEAAIKKGLLPDS